MLQLALRDDPAREPRMAFWLAAPIVAVVVLTLLARGRLPLAAPASVWLLCAALSFVDCRLIVFPVTLYAAGLAAAFLHGSLRDAVQGRWGSRRPPRRSVRSRPRWPPGSRPPRSVRASPASCTTSWLTR